jgi:hypothetical protein
MVNKIRPFQADLHSLHDNEAKVAMITFLENVKHVKAWENPNKYGIDVITDNYLYEVEVKTSWNTDVYKYKDLHIPYRKLKWCNNPLVCFVVMNASLTVGAGVKADDVLKSPVEWHTNYGYTEQFITVDLKHVTFINLKEKNADKKETI